MIWPLAEHPYNNNEVIVWDLTADPRELIGLSADDIRARMFTSSDEMPEGVSRLPLRTIKLNKSPAVIRNLKALSDEQAAKWGFDKETCLKNAQTAAVMPELYDPMEPVWKQVFKRSQERLDVDEDLYGGFIGASDRRLLNNIRRFSPSELAQAKPSFTDLRLEEILFRYRARNFPETLSESDCERWSEHQAERLFGEGGADRTVDEFVTELEQLAQTADDRQKAILAELQEYPDLIMNC